jgi:hypothetical protein
MPEESKKNPESKEPFVGKEDRPEVKITMDTPLSELRVRDLSSIVGAGAQKNPFEVGKTSLKDFFDKEFPEVVKDFVKEAKIEKFEKNELKDLKHDKQEKFEKNEKREKREIKEVKAEKVEIDQVVVDPGRIPGPDPDPRFEQLIEAVAGLTKQVSQLSNQVEELKRKG